MFSISRNFIRVNDSLFEVIKSYPEGKVLNVDLIKEWLGTEITFKREGVFYFCNQISDLEIIND